MLARGFNPGNMKKVEESGSFMKFVKMHQKAYPQRIPAKSPDKKLPLYNKSLKCR
jgi:hypothetical protein